LYARCRGLLGFVGGCVVRSEHGRVQSGYDRIQARPGGCGAPRCKVGVATRRRHHAVQTCVQCEARRGAGARERAALSARAGRHGGIRLAWSGCGVRWVRGGGVPWNWSWACWKLDGEVTDREVVGAALPVLGAHGGYSDDQGRRGVAGAWSLQGGAGIWVPVGWRSVTGGRGRRLVEGEGERRGFCRAVPRAPPPPSIQTENDKGKGSFGDLLNPEKILAGPFPPLGRFAKEK
jgi:hypothetical protein